MDILHVASARAMGTREFLTFDTRQRALAVAVGLKVKP
jgi:predicted nucleic acid-binding protein